MSWARTALRSRVPLSQPSASLWRSGRLPTVIHPSPTGRPSRIPKTHDSASITTRSGLATSPPSDAESSVARGTRYEHLCARVLAELFAMSLERTGGAGDRGIDLRGWWPLPSSRRIRVVAQCKCQDEGGKKMGPVLVREVEGVVFRASSPALSQDDAEREAPIAGVILSSSGFSKQALLQVRSSGVPLAALHVRATKMGEEEDEGGLAERCVSVVWNDKFGGKGGLVEEGMEVRWVRSLRGGGGDRPVIWRDRKPLKG